MKIETVNISFLLAYFTALVLIIQYCEHNKVFNRFFDIMLSGCN